MLASFPRPFVTVSRRLRRRLSRSRTYQLAPGLRARGRWQQGPCVRGGQDEERISRYRGLPVPTSRRMIPHVREAHLRRRLSWSLLVAGLLGGTRGGRPAAAFGQTPVTFSGAMTMVEQRNERWRAADLAVTRARESRAEQRGLLWPTVGVTGRYAHFNHELFVDLSALHDLLSTLNPGASIPPLSATVLKNDPVKVSLGASWTVFAGGRIRAANRAAEAGVEAADAERGGARQVLTTELVDRDFKRRLAADVLNVRRQALETLERHVQDAQRLEQAGQIARTESLRAQVARAEADRDYKV